MKPILHQLPASRLAPVILQLKNQLVSTGQAVLLDAVVELVLLGLVSEPIIVSMLLV